MYRVRKCSDFILLHVAVQFPQHHLLKRLSFPHFIFLPGKSNGQRSLADYSPRGHKELVTTERPNNNKLAMLLFSHSSRVQFLETPWTAARQASLSFTISQNLLKLISIESIMPSSHLILCHLPSFLALNLFLHQGLF